MMLSTNLAILALNNEPLNTTACEYCLLELQDKTARACPHCAAYLRIPTHGTVRTTVEHRIRN